MRMTAALLSVLCMQGCALVGQIEELGALCADGEDNDGDEITDCEELTCFFHEACRCGNGLTEEGEECDFGPFNSDTEADRCRTDCSLPTCGDSIVDSFEECDDLNAVPNDGCSELCLVEYCGDGVVNNGQEQCDDGNQQSGDTCSESCVAE
jgi:cysteine-rich repeat protein